MYSDIFSITTCFLFAALGLSSSARHISPKVSSELYEKHGITPRAIPGPRPATGEDCGVFTMDCTKAMGACNNAGFYQNCISQERSETFYTYRDDQSDNNRIYSGCTTVGTPRVCKSENRDNPYSKHALTTT